MTRIVTALLSVLWLGGCGVLIPYMYDAQTLQDELMVSIRRSKSSSSWANRISIVLGEGRQTILEYRLYPQGDWTAYLIHCPFFPNCYFPGEAGHPIICVTGQSIVPVGNA